MWVHICMAGWMMAYGCDVTSVLAAQMACQPTNFCLLLLSAVPYFTYFGMNLLSRKLISAQVVSCCAYETNETGHEGQLRNLFDHRPLTSRTRPLIDPVCTACVYCVSYVASHSKKSCNLELKMVLHVGKFEWSILIRCLCHRQTQAFISH